MQKNYLEIKIQDKIAWIKINREEKLNALNISMLEEIRENLIDLGKNKNVLVLVIIGSGDKAFVAGADIAEFSKYTFLKFLDFHLIFYNSFLFCLSQNKSLLCFL